jgi:hypothetical protein
MQGLHTAASDDPEESGKLCEALKLTAATQPDKTTNTIAGCMPKSAAVVGPAAPCTYLGCWVDHVQVIDQLRQVLNGVDVVVGRGADQGHTCTRTTQRSRHVSPV